MQDTSMQEQLKSADLETILSLVRLGTLAAAGERLGVDSSTVFRSVQRIERQLGQSLFERSRSGYQAKEMAQTLATHAERIEAELDAARNAAQQSEQHLSGTVRITTTDTVLHGLVVPALVTLKTYHPDLQFELQTGNELANLSRRDADIALRATKRPPQHLVGKPLGVIRVAIFMAKRQRAARLEQHIANDTPWIAPDDALPDHPSVLWRRKHVPRATVQYRVNSILSVAELIAQGVGIGIIPLFLAQGRNDLRQISEPLEEGETSLWLLSHTESRHLRRISAVFTHFSHSIVLP
jgi:DNA-binding transcriptional LysR family regulator